MKKYFYCTNSVIKLECAGYSSSDIASTSKASSTSTIGSSNHFESVPEDNSNHHILFHFLNNKIFQSPGHKKRTVPEIVKLFQQYFPWLSEQCGYKFIQKHQSVRDKACASSNVVIPTIKKSDDSGLSSKAVQSTSSLQTPTKTFQSSSMNGNIFVTPGMLMCLTYF